MKLENSILPSQEKFKNICKKKTKNNGLVQFLTYKGQKTRALFLVNMYEDRKDIEISLH